MTEVNEEDFGSGVPSDSEIPHLHVICHQKNYILNRLSELPAKDATKNLI